MYFEEHGVTSQAEPVRLPNFDSPPVAEVALSIQFAELVNFRAIHLGLLWEALGKENFPSTEEQPPVANAMERSSASNDAPQIEFLNMPPLPRVMFISETGNLVVQMQPDRFTVNWRKRNASDIYPRYQKIKSEFLNAFSKLEQFLAKENLGSIRITQAEITYVNRIQMEGGSSRLERIVSVYSGSFSDDFLHDPDEVHLSLRFPVQEEGRTLGRLYIDIRPGIGPGSEASMNMLLLARGKPVSNDINGALHFFEVARKYIVSSFASITSEQMHLVWQRREDA